MAKRPIPHTVYSVREVGELYLLDDPFLRLHVDTEMVQERFGDSCGFEDQLTLLQTECSGTWEERYPENAGFQALRFRYNRTTDEWIPIFTAVNSEQCFKLCSAVLYSDLDTRAVAVEVYVPGTTPAIEDESALQAHRALQG